MRRWHSSQKTETIVTPAVLPGRSPVISKGRSRTSRRSWTSLRIKHTNHNGKAGSRLYVPERIQLRRRRLRSYGATSEKHIGGGSPSRTFTSSRFGDAPGPNLWEKGYVRALPPCRNG